MPDPEPIIWFQVAVTVVAAGVLGGGAAWLLARRLGL